MTINFLTSWPLDISAGSGTAYFINNFKKELEKRGYEIRIINPTFKSNNYHIYTIKRIFYNLLLPFTIKLSKDDMVVAFDYDGFALLPGRCIKIVSTRGVFADVAGTEQGLFNVMLKIQAFFEKINLKYARKIFVASSYAKDCLIKYYYIQPGRINVIPNGIDLDGWDKMCNQADLEKRDNKVILAVAKLYPRKGIKYLIYAFQKIQNRHHNVELRIVGDGFEYESLKKLSHDLKLEEKIKFYGNIADRNRIAGLYKNCDIFCHPSIQETFGNVLLEAMASGKPAVVFGNASMPEIVKHGVNGLCVPPKDANALSQALLRLLEDQPMYQAMAENARKMVKKYAWQNSVDLFIGLISDYEKK